jgi:predicted nicotinamide N-methyase
VNQINDTGILEMMRGTPPPTWEQTCLKLSEEKRELQDRIKRMEGSIEKLKDAGDLVLIWLLYNRSHLGGLDVDSALREWKQSKKEAKL